MPNNLQNKNSWLYWKYCLSLLIISVHLKKVILNWVEYIKNKNGITSRKKNAKSEAQIYDAQNCDWLSSAAELLTTLCVSEGDGDQWAKLIFFFDVLVMHAAVQVILRGSTCSTEPSQVPSKRKNIHSKARINRQHTASNMTVETFQLHVRELNRFNRWLIVYCWLLFFQILIASYIHINKI